MRREPAHENSALGNDGHDSHNTRGDEHGNDVSIPHRDPAVFTLIPYELERDRDNAIDDIKIMDADATHLPVYGATGPVTAFKEAVPYPQVYQIDLWKAIYCGLAASLVFTALWYPLYFAYGTDSLDFMLLMGSFIWPHVDNFARLLGFFIHLGIGVGVSITYAGLLLFFRTQSRIEKGALFGFALNFAALTLGLPLAVGMAPLWANLVFHDPTHAVFQMPDMGLNRVGNASNGWEPSIISLMAYLVYGMFLGGLYRHKVIAMHDEAEAGFYPRNAHAH